MPAKKFIATTAIIFALATQVSTIAFAEDDKGYEGGHSRVAVPPMVITPDSENDGEDGEDGEDDGSSFNIKTSQRSFKVTPPISGNLPATIVPGVTVTESTVESNVTTVNPNANVPIEMNSGRLTKKTPADVFVESAQVGLGAMAVGAAFLGVTAAVRGARFRRQAKTDFIYEVES